jgi:hypothetical protein
MRKLQLFTERMMRNNTGEKNISPLLLTLMYDSGNIIDKSKEHRSNKSIGVNVMELKQQYFVMVDSKREYKEKLDELTQEWNERVCWEGSDAEVNVHLMIEENTRQTIKQIDLELMNMRAGINKETLKQWSKEYYGGAK